MVTAVCGVLSFACWLALWLFRWAGHSRGLTQVRSRSRCCRAVIGWIEQESFTLSDLIGSLSALAHWLCYWLGGSPYSGRITAAVRTDLAFTECSSSERWRCMGKWLWDSTHSELNGSRKLGTRCCVLFLSCVANGRWPSFVRIRSFRTEYLQTDRQISSGL